jgi:hypothetical protein
MPTVIIEQKPIENEIIKEMLPNNNTQNPVENSDAIIENQNPTTPIIVETPIKEESIV